jgi:hypothetical protein
MKGAGVPRQKIAIARSSRKRRNAARFSRSHHRVFGGAIGDESIVLCSRVTREFPRTTSRLATRDPDSELGTVF